MPAFLQRIFLKLKNKFMIQFMNTLNWYCNIQSLMIMIMIMMIRRYMHGFSHICWMSHAFYGASFKARVFYNDSDRIPARFKCL